MRRTGGWIILLCCIVGNIFSAPHTLPGQYVVKFKERTDTIPSHRRAIAVISSAKNAGILSPAISVHELLAAPAAGRTTFNAALYSVLVIDSAQDPSGIIQYMRSDPSVDYVEPVYRYNVDAIPNDSAYSGQWNLRRIGMSSLFEEGIITSALPDIIVGIVDTGIDEFHPDLAGTLAINEGETGTDGLGRDKRTNGIDDDGNGYIDDWSGYDFVDLPSHQGIDWNVRDNDPQDENGHGTSVASIVGARSGNTKGISGFGPVALLPLRAFAADGTGSDIDIAAAIIYAADNGAEIINMSFGDAVNSLLLRDAIQYAHSKNVVLIASSGNDGSDNPHYPSDLTDVISVGSATSFDSKSFFSSYGPSLDIMAPGESIPAASLNGGYTASFSGTSAAAPQVSGSIAVIKSIERDGGASSESRLSNDEILGLLESTADDIGNRGWDSLTASGIVNVSAAVRSLKGSMVSIDRPTMDDVATGIVTVSITSLSPYFKSLSVSFGREGDRSAWKELYSSGRQHYRDSVLSIDANDFNEGTYIILLHVLNSKGNDVETQVRIQIRHEPPAVVQFSVLDSVLNGNRYGVFIEAVTDDPTRGSLYFRKKSSTEDYSVLRSEYEGRHHWFFLTDPDIVPGQEYEFYTEFSLRSIDKNTVRFPTTAMNGFDRFEAQIPVRSISRSRYGKTGGSLPSGHLLSDVLMIDGKETVIMNEYDRFGAFGNLKLFQNVNGQFVLRDSIDRPWIPRSFVRMESGQPAVLVQDYGESRIYTIDTSFMKFSLAPLWVDSNDVWGSRLVDLTGDGKPEIIARNSTEILIYRNLGEGSFRLETHLPNPSEPLPGESKNQFGPPKILIGHVTNTSLNELIFADYDGDIVLYRQTTPNALAFTFAWADSSDLFDMSDYIALGDVNGDGLSDIICAGHSNTDLNGDREYDAPLWTVRIFAHAFSDAPGMVLKKWEQRLFGVHAGTSYDNAVAAGTIEAGGGTMAALSLNPNLYLYSFDTDFHGTPLWWAPSSSNTIVFHDGTVWVNDGSRYNRYTSTSGSTAQYTPPYDLRAVPLGPSSVRLTWQSDATQFIVYRGSTALSLAPIDSTVSMTYLDNAVTTGSEYFYSVQARMDSLNSQSGLSEIASTIPHETANLTSVVQPSPNQLLLKFSYDLTAVSLASVSAVLDGTVPVQQSQAVGPRSILTTFEKAIEPGGHTLAIRGLTDRFGMPVDTAQEFSFSATVTETSLFFVARATLLSPSLLRLEFNEGLQRSVAEDGAQYSVSNGVRSFSVVAAAVDPQDPFAVVLTTDGRTPLNALSLRIEITVSPTLSSIAGKPLNNGKSQTVSIAQEVASLDNIVVFPNPARYSPGKMEAVRFVNLPRDCAVTIYTVSGIKVRSIEQRSDGDGVRWDLKDDAGEVIASGVYVYRVELFDASGASRDSRIGKLVMVR